MPSLFDLDPSIDDSGRPGPLQIQPPDQSLDTSRADALTDTYSAVKDFVAKQRAISADRGLWDENTGLPTGAGLLDAARQYAGGILFGSTAPKGVTAFHGSPYDFDAFDASKIGTGEGNQSYGHGLYFAENPGVAQGYRDALASPKTPDEWAAWYLHDAGGDRNAATAQLTDHVVNGGVGATADQAANMRTALQLLKSGASITPSAPGRMYEVNIGADPMHFLDWDKPLSEQSQHVQGTLGDLGIQPPRASYSVRPVEGGHVVDYLDGNNQWTTSRVYKSADDAERQAAITMKMMNRDPTGAELVRQNPGLESKLGDAGIPGIRYLDQGSRRAGEGTRNYVVFDPSIVAIAKKYAVPLGVLSGTGAGLVQRQDSSQ